MSSATERAVRALRGGGLVVLPTDTVYGLACLATDEEAAARLYLLKGRDAVQPTAALFSHVDVLLDLVPELLDAQEAAMRAVLPGPFTLVLPNPGRRFPWLNTARPDTIGVRVPVLPAASAEVVGAVGAVVATSANLPGEPDPRRLGDVPERILRGVAAAVDGGDLHGTPSTVIDLTGPDPVVLRVGAGDAAVALARLTTGAARRRCQ